MNFAMVISASRTGNLSYDQTSVFGEGIWRRLHCFYKGCKHWLKIASPENDMRAYVQRLLVS